MCVLEESFIGWFAQVPRRVMMRLHLAEIFELGAEWQTETSTDVGVIIRSGWSDNNTNL